MRQEGAPAKTSLCHLLCSRAEELAYAAELNYETEMYEGDEAGLAAGPVSGGSGPVDHPVGTAVQVNESSGVWKTTCSWHPEDRICVRCHVVS
jgi:hypothetical protein